MTRRTSPITTRASNGASAFTLIEMVAVIALIAIGASLVAVNLTGIVPGYRLDASTRAIEDAIGRAVAIAAGQRRPVALVYDLDRERVSVQLREQPPERPGDVKDMEGRFFETALETGVEISSVVVHKGRTRDSGELKVSVSPRGIVDAHVVYVRDSRDRERTIEVAPVGAATRVVEGHVDADLFD